MHWQPAHEDHAIERVAVTFQLSEQIPSKPWRQLLLDADRRLPGKGFNDTLNELEVAPPGGGPSLRVHIQNAPGGEVPNIVSSTGAAPTPGKAYKATVGTAVHEELSLNRSRFIYATTRYDRWTSFADRFVDLIGDSLNLIQPILNINMIKLEYWDRFISNTDQAVYSELLRHGSKYLPQFSFETDGLWHCHIGYFEDAQTLINLNVDIINVHHGQAAEPLRRSVGIYSLAQVSIPGGSDFQSGMLSKLSGMHTILKGVLADVITDQAVERIGLNREPSQ